MRQVNLDWHGDHSTGLDPADIEKHAGDAARMLDEWSALNEESPLSTVHMLEMARRSRRWRPGSGPAESILWLHSVEDPSGDRLCAHVAEAVQTVAGLGLPEHVTKYLAGRASHLLGQALTAARHEGRLPGFLAERPLEFAGGRLECWEGIVLPLAEVLETFSAAPAGIQALRDALASGRDEFDAFIASCPERVLPALREGLNVFLEERAVVPTLTGYMDTFPMLARDRSWLGMLVAELERREQVEGHHADLHREGQLLAAMALSVSWSGDLLSRFADLELLATRHFETFRRNCLSGIALLWTAEQASAVYAVLCLQRHMRVRASEAADLGSVALRENYAKAVAALSGGDDVLFLLERLAEVSFGIPREKVAWTYMSQTEKGHWSWLVHSRIAQRPELIQSLIEFSMTWLPREPYYDVEPVLIELADDGGCWTTVEAISARRGGRAMLRAGSLLRRKELGRLPKPDFTD